MNNYLAGIAARTLSPEPPVRPRLPGRFEPASVFLERSMDSPESFHSETVKPSQPHSDRDRVVALKTTEERDSDRQPDPVPRGDISAATTYAMNRPAPPPVPVSVIEPSPLTTRAPNPQTVVEPPRPVEVRQASKVVDVVEEFRPLRKAPPALPEERNSEPRVEQIAGTPADLRHRTADEATPTTPQPDPKRKKPQSDRGDEEEKLAQPISHRRPVIEREPQTITVREKPARTDSERRNESKPLSPPSSDVTSPAARQDNSKAPPVFIQSRIAPLIDVGPFAQSRSEPQPTIHVTIGRLEVRAVQTPQSGARPRASTPVMNLDDYLKRRSQGGAQ